MQLQEQNRTAAREALALAQERYRVGANTFVDVTQARADYERAETDRINAIYEFHKAFAALESAVGRPSARHRGTNMSKKVKWSIGGVVVVGVAASWPSPRPSAATRPPRCASRP